MQYSNQSRHGPSSGILPERYARQDQTGDLDLAGIVHFNLRPVVLERHDAGNSNSLALEVEGRIVNPRLLKPCRPGPSNGDGQVVGVVVVFLRVEEDLRAVRAVLRRLDEQFYRDSLVDPVG